MRKQRLLWTIMVFGIVGTIYGVYSLIYHAHHYKELSIAGLVLLIFGLLALAVLSGLYLYDYVVNKKNKEEVVAPIEEEKQVEKVEPIKEEVKPKVSVNASKQKDDVEYVSRPQRSSESYSSYSVSTVYVKQVGYGPLLRVEGSRILDLRNNCYYRMENNVVMLEGSGPVFEIRGNQIKDAFGGYLYELSGNNINKVFGGFYASISGNYITLYDASLKYEMTDSLSKKQLLAVAALLFGKY